MESYYEQSLSRQNTFMCTAAYVLCWILVAVLLLIAVSFGTGVLSSDPNAFEISWKNVVGLMLCLGAAGILFIRKDHLRTEYDYFLKGDVLEIDAVLNRRRRKQMLQLDVKRILSVQSLAPCSRELPKKQGVKIQDLRVEPGGYSLYYSDANVRRMILLNLDEKMSELIQRRLNAGVWQDIEGK